jgi:hypothetical protein
LFHLFDQDQDKLLVQEDWVQFLKERLTWVLIGPYRQFSVNLASNNDFLTVVNFDGQIGIDNFAGGWRGCRTTTLPGTLIVLQTKVFYSTLCSFSLRSAAGEYIWMWRVSLHSRTDCLFWIVCPFLFLY